MNDRIEQMSEDACLKKYICEVCDAEFSKVHDIVNHMIDKHTTLKKYEIEFVATTTVMVEAGSLDEAITKAVGKVSTCEPEWEYESWNDVWDEDD